ncbi:porin-like protein [Rhizobium sp. PP-F2F-G48]|uniref:porin n=1 Tax=Rhizobium sp. PP-F2F-G48 TaxID=2135651 RepID=UPI001044FA8F|nr:porin [Rhizobium sp. PP-F2F-G48]TCM57806.1 porin-like protein [Rhizobium sp. PP-F2F-G48]
MNIKSLLLGSAAALAAVSGAHAADAIVAAEPEAMEYVRVCDAFGTGYFYIPGTETCLKIGGRVRTQVGINDGDDTDWQAYSQGYLTIEAKSDTEFGALTGYINLQADTDKQYGNPDGSRSLGAVALDGAWINLAGFDVGYFYNWWDEYGIAGETDESGGNLFNSARYTYDGGAFSAGVSVEDLRTQQNQNNFSNDDVGASALLLGTVGGVKALVIASYDFDVDESAFKGVVTADVGPGSLEIAGIYASDPNAYWSKSEWSVAASYALKASEKLTITPGAQYFGNVDQSEFGGIAGGISDDDAWKVGLSAEYQITTGLKTLATVNYTKVDYDTTPAGVDDDSWTGFLRLQRDF